MAPISPFFSDALYSNLEAVTGRNKAASVHHTDFPKANLEVIDPLLEERMQLAQIASSLVLSLRKKLNIKVRQPLQKILIPVMNPEMKNQLEKVADLLKAEVNVKEISYITETEGFIKKKVKANFKALGAKLGGQMKEAAAIIAQLSQHQIADLETDGRLELQLSAGNYTLLVTEVEIAAEDIPGWSVASKGTLTVALDITITEDLQNEGNAREFVNRIQNIRKESGFDLTDRIFVKLLDNENIKPSIIQFKKYICGEILADDIEFVPVLTTGTDIEVNETLLRIAVTKKG
jgi:isoleucyl-tRNA synthetase